MYQYWVLLGLSAVAVNAASISVDVGKGGNLKFSPNSVTAAVGDSLEFHFFSGSGGHSVVSSTFESPCVPAPTALFSGFIAGSSNGEMTFVTNVTNTDPIWFYCALATHCEAGMVGVVNPPAGKSVSDFAAAAANIAKASAPASLEGGVLTTVTESAAPSASTTGTTGSTGGYGSSSTSDAGHNKKGYVMVGLGVVVGAAGFMMA